MTKRAQKTIATIGIGAAVIAVALIVGIRGGDETEPLTPSPSAPAETGPSVEQTPPPVLDGITTTVPSPIAPADALELLATIPTEAPADADYERDDFGSGWIDIDRNGCDTRNDVLDRDLTETTYKPGTHDCVVLTGILNDPYSGAVIDFARGQDTSSLVQIDHLIPLSWAAQQGANGWDSETREQFANDPLNLLAVDGSANASKSDSGPSEWIPDAEASHCGYAARFVAVLDAYELTVPVADHDALEELLAGCTSEGNSP